MCNVCTVESYRGGGGGVLHFNNCTPGTAVLLTVGKNAEDTTRYVLCIILYTSELYTNYDTLPWPDETKKQAWVTPPVSSISVVLFFHLHQDFSCCIYMRRSGTTMRPASVHDDGSTKTHARSVVDGRRARGRVCADTPQRSRIYVACFSTVLVCINEVCEVV